MTRQSVLLLSLLAAGGLAGCSGDVSKAGGVRIVGTVRGGQQPLSGSTVQLYAVGTGGTRSAASGLLSTAVRTLADGRFEITGLSTCPANSLVYITATQGSAGGGANNPAIALMAAVGPCAALPQTVDVDEVTTVAAVYALSSFLADDSTVGYDGRNVSGITHAFAAAHVLLQSPVSGIALPTAEIDTLADAVSGCVNSDGPLSAGCARLFAAATPVGGKGPANTVAALANIAHNPAAHVAAIFGLVGPAAPFQPTLSCAPLDWTMSIHYEGGGLALPNGVAMDSLGNAWVANEGGNAVTELATGSFVSGVSGFADDRIVGAQGIAVDALNHVWIANTGGDSLLEMNAAGGVIARLTSGIRGPVSVAVDGRGDVWVANFDGDSLAEFVAGVPAAGSPFTYAGLAGPTGLAIDASNHVWVGNSLGNSVMLFDDGGVYHGSFTDGLLIAPGGIATDSVHGRVWTAATGIDAISGLTLSGGRVAGTPLAGGISIPLAVAVDGAGTVWTVSSVAAGSLAAFTVAGVGLSPAGLGSLKTPVGVAVDASGNVWTTAAGDNSVTEFIGLAAPTVTPLVSSGR